MTEVKRAYNRYSQLKCKRHQTAVAAGIISWVVRRRNEAARAAKRREKVKLLKDQHVMQGMLLRGIKAQAPNVYSKVVERLGLVEFSGPARRVRAPAIKW